MAGLVQNIDLALPDLPILRYWRNRGLKAFEAQGVPTAKTEAWRYTKPRDLNSDDFILSVTLPIITKSEQTQKIPFACYPIIFEDKQELYLQLHNLQLLEQYLISLISLL